MGGYPGRMRRAVGLREGPLGSPQLPLVVDPLMPGRIRVNEVAQPEGLLRCALNGPSSLVAQQALDL